MRLNSRLKFVFEGMQKRNAFKKRMKRRNKDLRIRTSRSLLVKVSSVSVIMALLINMMMVTTLPINAAPLIDAVAKFTDVNMEVDGNVVDINTVDPIEQDEAVTLKYDFVVTGGSGIADGDTIDVTVPDGFLIANDVAGDIVSDGGAGATAIGAFVLAKATRVLTLTFNTNVQAFDDWTGQVVLNSQFELDEIPGNDNPVVITFAINDVISKDVTLKFAPDNVASAIEKSGAADKAVNPTSIDWTVQVNKQLEGIDDVVIEDDFEDGLALDVGSIVVHELAVDLEGNAATTGPALVLDTDYTVTYDAGARELDVTLGDINTAYQITYTTDITDISKSSFYNTASFSGGSSEATVGGVSRGSLIQKLGTPDRDFNPTEITWTIEANKYEGPLVNGQITDTIPAGLTYKANSANLYEIPLNGDGSVDEGSVVDLGSVDGSYDDGTKTLTVDLGNTSKAYRLVFVTTIDNTSSDANYTNTSNLISDTVSIASDSDSVDATYGVWINKTGENEIDYAIKAVNWTIDVNTIEKVITGGMVTDVIPDDLTIDLGSIELHKRTFNADGSQNTSVELLNGDAIDYDGPSRTLTVDLDEVVNDNPGITEFDFALRITYTTDLDDVDKNGPFDNTATLTGTSGVGINESDDRRQNPSISNYIRKNYTNNSIDYAAKTMDWRIQVRPIKEAMQNLVITDTFPNGGLSFDASTLVINNGANLVEGVDYNVSSPDGDPKNGFVITFLEDVKDSQYTITYTTDFDRDWHTNAGSPRNYSNNAAAVWDENIGPKSDPNNSDSVEISTTARDNGNKNGSLRRIDKEIDWEVNVNYLSETFTDYTVVDTIPASEQDNQEMVIGSIKVYNYSVQASGNMVKGVEIDQGAGVGEYTIVNESATGFTIKFNGEISSPYRIEYASKLVNDTIDTYNNNATFDGKTVSASVNYANSNQFVSKNNPPSGISLDWEVTINTSLSMIENAVLTDTIAMAMNMTRLV